MHHAAMSKAHGQHHLFSEGSEGAGFFALSDAPVTHPRQTPVRRLTDHVLYHRACEQPVQQAFLMFRGRDDQ
jgi:hypothetical protein